MAISKVDICNLALSALGDQANVSSIDPPDDSAQAHYCATYYPVAKNAVLSGANYPWSFALRRVTLSETTNESIEWLKCFVMPSDMIGFSEFLDANGNHVVDYNVELHTGNVRVVYCNAELLQCRYVSSDTPEGLFTQPFIDALILTLQYYLVGSIVKGDVGVAARKAIYQQMLAGVSLARTADSQYSRPQRRYTPSILVSNGTRGDVIMSAGGAVYPKSYEVY